MPEPLPTLTAGLAQLALAPGLAALVTAVATTCKALAAEVARGALGPARGATGGVNVSGETRQALDVLANALFIERVGGSGLVAGMASEELDEPWLAPAGTAAPYLLVYDPLDGSSNIEVNVSIGTIFSVLPAPARRPLTTPDFLQPGTAQVAAGFCVYGPATVLVLTTGAGVQVYTLDPAGGEFVCTAADVRIPPQAKEYAINASNQRFWEAPVQRYVTECLAGRDGPRGRDFNMRWVASMVADVYRVLCRGGIFMYPYDTKDPAKPGKLRLMYEANPMSYIVEQAGGAASTGRQRILDVQPEKIHQRVPVILGSREEVERVVEYHRADGAVAPA